MSGQLKLLAEDAADLEIVSAAMQDALLRVADISVDKKQRRFTVMLNRFRWETTDGGNWSRTAAPFTGVYGIAGEDFPYTGGSNAWAGTLIYP